MLIKLSDIIQKHRLKITGVLHAGAHFGTECRDYQRAGIRKIYLFEPCANAFNILKRTYPNIPSFKYALGASKGEMQMNVERKNKGQSNSLLKPALHLEQFPDIIFDDTETVLMRTLDSFGITGCNFLNMDVQGYELEVLKGATETLKGINYIYTEVNRDEVYENCVRIEQLDLFLKDFLRVETDWSGITWGDALYIRKAGTETITVNENASEKVNENEFQPHINQSYPPDNDLIFEEWYSQQDKPESERIYFPVNWTSYYVNHKYGKDRQAIQKLQHYIDSFDKSKKYYTVIQFDDGILNNVTGLDLKVFSMSGHGLPIPLIGKPHIYKFNSEKKHIANFIGNKTHLIRNHILRIKNSGYYISDKKHSLEDFCRVISESVFTLCPRGYGKASFRIQEALQYGSIPVYISDDFILPPEFSSYGILISNEKEIESTINNITPDEILQKQNVLSEMYEKHFTYEALKKYIENNL